MQKINIAIDGFAGSGKSTTARKVADKLGYIYIDTGAMYRATTYYFLSNNIDFQTDSDEIKKALKNVSIRFNYRPELHACETILNGKVADGLIRTQEVNESVSKVSTLKSVRECMVKQQKEMGKEKGVVMDGRDIGTVVLPDAELKVFMTADLETRAKRRIMEVETKGIQFNTDEVKGNLLKRDEIDSNREIGPLKQAEDAILIDTSNLTIEDQVSIVIEYAHKIIQDIN